MSEVNNDATKYRPASLATAGSAHNTARFSPKTQYVGRVKGSSLEPPAVARIVRDEPGPVEVGVVRALRGDATCGDEDAGLEHAAHHRAHAELVRSHDEGVAEFLETTYVRLPL